MLKDWENFEEIARSVQEQLSPTARVTRNEKIKGKSGIQNQCDIVIRSRIGTTNFLGVIECKDHADKVDVEVVRGFKSKLDDIGAMKGIIVSAKGFTSVAYKYAGEVGIDVFLLVDASSIKWNNIAIVPICIAKIFLESCSIKNFNHETGEQIELEYDDGREAENHNYYYWDNIEKRYIALKDLIEKVWEDQVKPSIMTQNRQTITYSTEVSRFSLYQGKKSLVPVIIELELEANIEYHYGRLSLAEGQGFFDSQRDVLHSKEFQCSPILWKDALKNWPRTLDSSAIPFKPIFYIYIVRFFSKRDEPAPAMLVVGGGIK